MSKKVVELPKSSRASFAQELRDLADLVDNGTVDVVIAGYWTPDHEPDITFLAAAGEADWPRLVGLAYLIGPQTSAIGYPFACHAEA